MDCSLSGSNPASLTSSNSDNASSDHPCVTATARSSSAVSDSVI